MLRGEIRLEYGRRLSVILSDHPKEELAQLQSPAALRLMLRHIRARRARISAAWRGESPAEQQWRRFRLFEVSDHKGELQVGVDQECFLLPDAELVAVREVPEGFQTHFRPGPFPYNQPRPISNISVIASPEAGSSLLLPSGPPENSPIPRAKYRPRLKAGARRISN
jgi:hypothetical protein